MADGFRLEDDSGVIVLEDGASILLLEAQSSDTLFNMSRAAPLFYYVLSRRAGRNG